MGETMDRGTDLLKNKLQSCSKIEVRQGRRGWLQECLCCQTKSSFTYLNGEKTIGKSKEQFYFPCRCCCGPCHPFDMTIREPEIDPDSEEETEILTVNRSFQCCPGTCKCCWYQQADISSGGQDLGEIRETWYWCVPQMKVYDHNDDPKYIIHPPTCCGGACIDCFKYGNPCPHGCCIVPCDIYAADGQNTNDAERIGVMKKIPKDTCWDTFEETNYYEIEFPEDATVQQKGLLLGSSILINALYFENSE